MQMNTGMYNSFCAGLVGLSMAWCVHSLEPFHLGTELSEEKKNTQCLSYSRQAGDYRKPGPLEV